MTTILPTLNVVAGIVWNHQHEILISKRLSHKPLGNLWEFPGGKIETNENAFEALCRELFEEVGLIVHQAVPFFKNNHQYSDRYIIFECWEIKNYEGEAHGKEGQEIRWVKIPDLQNYDFPSANLDILTILLSG